MTFFSGENALTAGFIMLLLAVALLYAYPLKDNDLWWQMEIGQYLIEHKTLKPDHSIYSWTVADPNWVYNTWLAQTGLYALYLLGGLTALHAAAYLVVLSALALFVFYLRASGQSLSFFHLIILFFTRMEAPLF